MKSELILEKLATLDPDNKDHWNADGQPRLGAIGEGVKREEVLAAAPLFSRQNPELPHQEKAPDLTEEEVKEVLEGKAEELQSRRELADAALARSAKLVQEADTLRKQANAEIKAIHEELKALDPRTDAEINQDLLKSSFMERLQRAGAQAQARALLDQAGLSAHARALTSSPVDRAIADRVVAERRKKTQARR